MRSASIAEERIEILFGEAEKRFDEEPSLSQRYVELARRIGEKTQISIPREFRKRFCSKCNTYWKPSKNCRVRIDSKNRLIRYNCLECGETENYGY